MFALTLLTTHLKSASRCFSTKVNYPFPLHIIPLNGTKLGVSFIPLSDTRQHEGLCIGWLDRNDASPEVSNPHHNDLTYLQENFELLDAVHSNVLARFANQDSQLIAMAKHQKEGWLHVPGMLDDIRLTFSLYALINPKLDQRNPAPWGR
jgi:hypothetical protein